MNTLAYRVIFHIVGLPLLRALVLPLFMLLFAIAMLDASVDWTATRMEIASLDPWLNSVLFTGLILAWSAVAGRALRPVWQSPGIRFLLRQPLTRWRWAMLLLPSLAIAFVPIAAIWWLAPVRVTPAVHYLGFVGLGWPIIFGASGRSAVSVAAAAAGTCVLTVLIYGYLNYPSTAYAAVFVTLAQLPLGAALIRREVAQAHGRISTHLIGESVLAVIVRRDLRCLTRTDPKRLIGAGILGLVASLMVLAFRVNGGVEGRDAFVTACVFLTVAALPIYELLDVVKRRLGREIMRRRWPVGYAQRAIALVALIALIIGPSTVLILVLGSTMGIANQFVFLLFAGSVTMLAAGLFASRLVVERNDIGWFYFMLVCHMLLSFALPAWAYATLAAALIPTCLILVTHSLSAFSEKVEGAHEQAA